MLKGSQEYLTQGAGVILLVCIKNTCPEHLRSGREIHAIVASLKAQEGHGLALRLAPILARLFFFPKVSLLYSSDARPCDRRIKGPLQRSLSFKQPFPKITKEEERKSRL